MAIAVKKATIPTKIETKLGKGFSLPLINSLWFLEPLTLVQNIINFFEYYDDKTNRRIEKGKLISNSCQKTQTYAIIIINIFPVLFHKT